MPSLPWPSLLALGASAVGVVCVTPLVMQLAHRLGWVAIPKADRWHRKPTALMGGIGIFAGIALGVAVAWAAGVRLSGPLPAVLVGAAFMFGVGVVDDRRPLSPTVKLVCQVLAAVLALGGGIGFTGWPLYISVPLTLVWLIGITNAVNLLDNMDGLASGVSAIAAGVLGVYGLFNGQPAAAALCFAVAGAAGGFLVFNFNPARVFMGDGGSLLLGYTVGALALVVSAQTGQAGLVGVFLVPTAVMAVPIFDTTLVTLMRSFAGRAVSQGGRDHSSHRLVMLGLSERKAVLLLYAVSLVFGAAALLFEALDARFSISALVVLVAGLAVFGRVLGELRIYAPSEVPQGRLSRLLHAGDGVVISTVLLYKRQVLGMLLDIVLVTAAHLLAYALRFEGDVPPSVERVMELTLPIVILWKVAALLVVGLHRQIWRYTGVDEIARVALAAGLGAAGLVGGYFLFFVRGEFSLSVVALDMLLTFGALSGVRLAVRALRVFTAAQRVEGERVLLYGAGDAGALVLSELRHNPALRLVPVGFIDDDSTKRHAYVYGVRVLGDGEDLPDLCRKLGVERVLLAAPTMTPERVEQVRRTCHALGLRLSRFTFAIEDMPGEESLGDGSQQAVRLRPAVRPGRTSRSGPQG